MQCMQSAYGPLGAGGGCFVGHRIQYFAIPQIFLICSCNALCLLVQSFGIVDDLSHNLSAKLLAKIRTVQAAQLL